MARLDLIPSNRGLTAEFFMAGNMVEVSEGGASAYGSKGRPIVSRIGDVSGWRRNLDRQCGTALLEGRNDVSATG